MNELAKSTPPESFGRYLLYPAIARGGMATVHAARLVGAEGFTRLVAAKRLHPQLTDDPDFVTMFHDEACIASRIHHPNVVPVLDIVMAGQELILVQEYVHGVPLSALLKGAHHAGEPIAVDVVIAVLTGVLAGLHAAHEIKDEGDRPLEIVHRDVSPQNIMVSVDGIPRLLDFGIAKARTSTHHTREGVFKGKLAYMAPEQLRMEGIDRTVDIYATGVLAWELLVNRRVYDGRHELTFVTAVMRGEIPTITSALEEAHEAGAIDEERWRDLVALEPVVSRAMAPLPEDRFATAEDMLRAILDVRVSATSMAVAEWVRSEGADFLDERQKTLAASEESSRRTSVFVPTSSPPPIVPEESGAYRVALGVPRLARLGARMRFANLLPWLAALLFVVAGLVGGLLRTTDPPPVAIIESAPALPAALAPAPNPAPAPAPVPTLAPAAPSARAIHSPPPPPQAQAVFIPRPSLPPPPRATTSATDCTPPFFFEGTKKVFKPSCL